MDQKYIDGLKAWREKVQQAVDLMDKAHREWHEILPADPMHAQELAENAEEKEILLVATPCVVAHHMLQVSRMLGALLIAEKITRGEEPTLEEVMYALTGKQRNMPSHDFDVLLKKAKEYKPGE